MCRYKSEVSQQKVLFRGSFGTQRPGGARHNAFDIFMKNAANTSIVYWGGRLLALFEAAQPTAMDPYTLQTLGPDLLGGLVKPGASFDFGKVANQLLGAPFSCLLLSRRLFNRTAFALCLFQASQGCLQSWHVSCFAMLLLLLSLLFPLLVRLQMRCVFAEGLFRALGVEGRRHGGESTLGGEAVTAHPRYDPDTGETVYLELYVANFC